MGPTEGRTVTLMFGRWSLTINRTMGWREWRRTDYFIVGMSVEAAGA